LSAAPLKHISSNITNFPLYVDSALN
jgi:hypothetical protein